MKWKGNSTPQKGDIRKRRVFAWWKTKVGDHWVWLETYEITEQCFPYMYGGWFSEDTWWAEVSRTTLVDA